MLEDATDILQQIRVGAIGVDEVLRAHLARLRAGHPQLNAATQVFEPTADELPAGSLHGLPMSVKECYAIAGEQLTSGSLRMPPIASREDAAAVARLRASGAAIIARGNTSEFLLGRETTNLRFGRSNNAINTELTAGGSSGGDAALVAAGHVAAAIGTDIGGSIRIPAAFNGIVGFKPASGQIDKAGLFPCVDHFAESYNSPGILCRSVRDARLLYGVLAGRELAPANPSPRARLRVDAAFGVDIEDAAIRRALAVSQTALTDAGIEIKAIALPDSGRLHHLHMDLLVDAFLQPAIEWSRTATGQALSLFRETLRKLAGKPTISAELWLTLLGARLFKPSAARVRRAIAEVGDLRTAVHAELGEDSVLLLPTLGLLAPSHGRFIPRYSKPGVIRVLTPIGCGNVLNLSCISLPAWRFAGAGQSPPALMLLAAPGREALLLDVAAVLENVLQNSTRDAP